MSRREQVVRAALALLVIGVLVTLVLRDRTTAGDEDRSEATPSPTAPATSAPSDPSDPSEPPTPAPLPSTEADDVPAPPPGLESLVCRRMQKSLDLRVVSFNTHRSYGPPGSLEAVAEEIRQLEPDVVLLQEVDRFFARTGNVDQAARFAELLDMKGSFSANVVRGASEYGTLVLSPHKIRQEGRFGLPHARGAERRGLQWVTLEVGDRQVRVYNTHLQHTMPRLRTAQARYVAGVLAQEELPVILGGDLNATPGSAPLGALSDVVSDSWSAGVGRAATGGQHKIDYILTDREFEPLRSSVLPSAVSDHHRLWADVKLRPEKDCGRRS